MRTVDDHHMGGKVMGRSLRELLDGAKRLWDASLRLLVIGILDMGYRTLRYWTASPIGRPAGYGL